MSRLEHARFLLTLKKSAVDSHEGEIHALISSGPPLVEESGVLKVRYEVWIEYFGSVERRLEAINRMLLDPSIILDADVEELKTGRCLIAEVLKNIDAIHQHIEAKQPVGPIARIRRWLAKVRTS